MKITRITHSIGYSLLLLLLYLTCMDSAWSDDCSNYIGQATINEVYRMSQGQATKDYFVELKILDNSITKSTYNQWYLIFCSVEAKDNGLDECSTQISVVESNDNNNEWLVMKDFDFHYIDINADKAKKNDHGMEVTLWDENGQLIDYLSVDGYAKTGDKGCSFPYDTDYPGSNSFDLKRLNEDGTGDWTSEPGNSDKSTEDSSNDGSGASCTLGSLSIVQDAHALACPQTRASVNIVPYCDDGTTVKTDYAGTVNLSSNSSSALFYDAGTGGNTIANITFDGSSGIATVYLYNNQEQAVQVAGTDAAASPDVSGTGNATDFRAYGFNITVPDSSAICGMSNPVTVTAFGKVDSNSGCSIITGFSGTKDLKVWLDPYYIDLADTPAGSNTNIKLNSSILPLASPAVNNITGVNFVSGQASLDVNWDDAGRVHLQVKHDDYPYDGSSGADYDAEHRAPLMADSGEIVLRPDDFAVLAKLADGTVLNNISPTISSPVVKAVSDTFDVEVTANCANNTIASNFTAAVQLLPAAPDFAVTGSLGPVASPSATPVSGIATFNNLTYDEVGHFTLTAETVTDYLGTGISISGSHVTGRFIPAQFYIDSHSLAPGWGCDFAYMGQANIVVNYTIQALTGGAGPKVLQNYHYTVTDNHAKASFAHVLEDDNKGSGPLLSRFTPALNYSPDKWGDGLYVIDNSSLFTFERDIAPDGSFEPLILGMQMTDDGESDIDIPLTNALDMNHTTSDDCLISASSCNALEIGTINIKYGRLNIANAYGPEHLPLSSVKVSTEYYDGSGFTLNTIDSCSTYDSASDIDWTVAGYSGLANGDIESTGSATLNNGIGMFMIHKTADITLGPGKTGYVDYDFVTSDWLKFDWQGTGDADPHPRASFGLYSRSRRLIYSREVY